MDRKLKKKIIVIVGPTASGKSNLSVTLAREIGGEIISADSRQVYKELTIGTGKITKKEMRGVSHHLLDIVSLRQLTLRGAQGFTAAQFKSLAEKKIEEITRRRKVPIVVGGTGFYIDTLLGTVSLPHVPPNLKLRKSLGNKSPESLFVMLKKLDSRRARNIDKKNKVRLIRAIEIAKALGKVPKPKKRAPVYDVLKIGFAPDNTTLKQNISIRLFARIKEGMIGEAKKLHQKGLSWKRMEELGLEYRYLAQFLQGKARKEELVEKLTTEIWRYAKRQRRWFKRDTEILWYKPKDIRRIKKEIAQFLAK